MCTGSHENRGISCKIRRVKGQRLNISFGLFLICCIIGIFLIGDSAFAAAIEDSPADSQTAVETPQTPEDRQDGKWITVKGEKYYQFQDGTRAKKQFVEIQGKRYYFGKKGVMQTGWMKQGKDYYYFDRSSGAQKLGGKVDGISIKKNGKAKKTAYSKKKLAVMIEAKKIVNKVTKPTDKKSEKLKKVFNWVLKHPYKRYRILAQARRKKGWEMDYANDIYKNGQGCCVSESCALAFLAKECGYKKVYVCDDTGHAWVEINGKVYDTLFAETKGYNKYYGSDYKTARLHRVNKHKI